MLAFKPFFFSTGEKRFLPSSLFITFMHLCTDSPSKNENDDFIYQENKLLSLPTCVTSHKAATQKHTRCTNRLQHQQELYLFWGRN